MIPQQLRRTKSPVTIQQVPRFYPFHPYTLDVLAALEIEAGLGVRVAISASVGAADR